MSITSDYPLIRLTSSRIPTAVWLLDTKQSEFALVNIRVSIFCHFPFNVFSSSGEAWQPWRHSWSRLLSCSSSQALLLLPLLLQTTSNFCSSQGLGWQTRAITSKVYGTMCENQGFGLERCWGVGVLASPWRPRVKIPAYIFAYSRLSCHSRGSDPLFWPPHTH